MDFESSITLEKAKLIDFDENKIRTNYDKRSIFIRLLNATRWTKL